MHQDSELALEPRLEGYPVPPNRETMGTLRRGLERNGKRPILAQSQLIRRIARAPPGG